MTEAYLRSYGDTIPDAHNSTNIDYALSFANQLVKVGISNTSPFKMKIHLNQ